MIKDVPRPESMSVKVLHISNTDIESDSRIRKELASLGEDGQLRICVVGVPANGRSGTGVIDGAEYRRVVLWSRALKPLPRALRYVFELIEFTIKTFFWGVRQTPTVVHSHDAFALPAGWLLSLTTKAALVYDAHELESQKNAQTPALSLATLMIERVCWARIRLLVSVSESILDWYHVNLGKKVSVLVLNAPVLRDEAAPQGTHGDAYFHSAFAIPDDHLVCVYLGILGQGRGIEAILEAFSRGLSNASVVFVGYGALDSLIDDYARSHRNIHRHPPVPHDQVVPLVRSADIGLCLIENTSLSDYLCLPNKLFEYVFAQLPVLASDLPEIRKVIEKYGLGRCCDGTPAAIRDAIAAMGEQRPTVAMGKLAELSWETQAGRLRSAYHALLHPPDHPA